MAGVGVVRFLRPAAAAGKAFGSAAVRPTQTLLLQTAIQSRAFSGNVEYPRIEGSVVDVTKTLNSIGARLSIPTAALYLTKQKLEFVVRGMKTVDELRDVQKVLLLCDAKFVYPSEFTIGSFISAAIRLKSPDVALDFVRQAQHLRHYMQNQSFVRLATHYENEAEDETVKEIAQIVETSGVEKTHKWFGFQVAHAKRNGDMATAEAIAKQAADDQKINSHVILTLLEGLEGEALAEKLPLAHYLVAKGDVFVNDKLKALLTPQ